MTFIQEAETTTWTTTTSPKTTPSFNALKADILVACAVSSLSTCRIAPTNNGAALVWTLAAETDEGFPSVGFSGIWTTVLAEDRAGLTVTFTRTGATAEFGGSALTFRSVRAVGDSGDNANTFASPSVVITTTATGSTIVGVNSDTAVQTGTPTYRPGAGAATELSYATSATYTIYVWYHAAAGAAGNYTIGMTVPSSQYYAIAAVELIPTLPSEPGAVAYTKGKA